MTRKGGEEAKRVKRNDAGLFSCSSANFGPSCLFASPLNPSSFSLSKKIILPSMHSFNSYTNTHTASPFRFFQLSETQLIFIYLYLYLYLYKSLSLHLYIDEWVTCICVTPFTSLYYGVEYFFFLCWRKRCGGVRPKTVRRFTLPEENTEKWNEEIYLRAKESVEMIVEKEKHVRVLETVLSWLLFSSLPMPFFVH